MVDMKFTTSKDTFIKGEPIFVTCTLSNRSTNGVTFDLGCDRLDGFLFSLDGGNQFSISMPDGPLSHPAEVQLKAGEAYQSGMVLDEWRLLLGTGSNSIMAFLDYKGTKLTNTFVVKLVEPSGIALEVALGELAIRMTMTPFEKGIDLRRGLIDAEKQYPRTRYFFDRLEGHLREMNASIDAPQAYD